MFLIFINIFILTSISSFCYFFLFFCQLLIYKIYLYLRLIHIILTLKSGEKNKIAS